MFSKFRFDPHFGDFSFVGKMWHFRGYFAQILITDPEMGQKLLESISHQNKSSYILPEYEFKGIKRHSWLGTVDFTEGGFRSSPPRPCQAPKILWLE